MDDLISRQVALDAIDKVAEMFPYRIPGQSKTYRQYNEAWSDACDASARAVEGLPSAQPQWIPCSEETPKENGFYLLSSGGTVLIAYYSDGEWLSELPLIMTENNTAWMPLPQPYGAETERTMEEFMYGQDLGSPEDGSL